MASRRALLLTITHALAAGLGFAAGIYLLPILIAPAPPMSAEVQAVASKALFTAEFRRDLKDSDALHWGEGKVSIGGGNVGFIGKIAPGPDYKLYFSPEFVETEADFFRLKEKMVRVGDVKTFENFIVPIPAGIDPANYVAVIVWCEAFSQFITAAKYR